MKKALLAAAVLTEVAGVTEIYPHKSSAPRPMKTLDDSMEAIRKAQAKRDRKAKRNLRNKQ